MAVLRQGSVISATVEQSLGNCLLISFKHRSKTFRGVLFDEKNSSVSRPTANRPSNDSNMLVNNSSLPLGTAIVSPSRQPYSSLRNRIYYNNNSKRSGSSSSRSSSSKSNDSRSNSGLKSSTQQGFSGKESESSQGQRKPLNGHENGTESRQSSRLLRQRSSNSSENGNGTKRKAEIDLVCPKPLKSRPTQQTGSNSTYSQNPTRNSSKSHKKSTLSKQNIEKAETKVSDSIEKTIDVENIEKSESNVIDSKCSLKELDGDQFTKLKHDLFPNDNTGNENNVFCNDQVDYHCNPMKKDLNNFDENDTVTAFFGSLGLGRKGSNSDKDDASIATDSGTSSSSDILFPQPDNSDDTGIDLRRSQDNSNNEEITANETATNKIIPLTPTKKSARISAKRAILEKTIDSVNDETTIWSIWGGLPSQNKVKNKLLSEDDLTDDNHEDNINMSPESIDSNDIDPFDQSQQASNKVKGPRMKQTPVRIKKVASTVVQPEKQVSVGNVVWGKVHGHPWWPGRVLAVSGNIDEGNEVIQHAHVTWFGSNTSSIMPVNELQHFLANFKRRFKRTKKGCYRKAVKQAQEMLAIMGEI